MIKLHYNGSIKNFDTLKNAINYAKDLCIICRHFPNEKIEKILENEKTFSYSSLDGNVTIKKGNKK